MHTKVRRSNLLGRMRRIMQDTKVEVTSESQPTDKPVRGARSKSSFDDAEYERWSEKLRSRSNSRDK
jgi:hypothetical protein